MYQTPMEIAESMQHGDETARTRALEIYDELFRDGDETACFNAGILCHNNGNFKKASFYLKKLPTNPEACQLLGYYYLYGMGMKKSKMMALTWFRRGALAGDATCQLEAGKLLLGHEDFECAAHLRSAKNNGMEEAAKLLEMEL